MNNIFDIKRLKFSLGLIIILFSSCNKQTSPNKSKNRPKENFSESGQNNISTIDPLPNTQGNPTPENISPDQEQIITPQNDDLVPPQSKEEEAPEKESEVINEQIVSTNDTPEIEINEDSQTIDSNTPPITELEPEKEKSEEPQKEVIVQSPQSPLFYSTKSDNKTDNDEVIEQKVEKPDENIVVTREGAEEEEKKVLDLTLDNVSAHSSKNKEVTHIDKMYHWTKSLYNIELDEKADEYNRQKTVKINEYRDKFREFLEEYRTFFGFTTILYTKLDVERGKSIRVIGLYQQQNSIVYLSNLYQHLEAAHACLRRSVGLIQEILRSSFNEFLDRLQKDSNKLALSETDIQYLDSGIRNHNEYLTTIRQNISQALELIDTHNKAIRTHNSNSGLLSNNFVNEKPPKLGVIDLSKEKNSFLEYNKGL